MTDISTSKLREKQNTKSMIYIHNGQRESRSFARNAEASEIGCTASKKKCVSFTDRKSTGQIFKLFWSCLGIVKCDTDLKSLGMRNPAFCICENKGAYQLRGKREADQRLCFRYTDSTISLLPKSEISSL